MDINGLATIFLQGIAIGSGPCLMFCAPIVLPFLAGTQRSMAEGIWAVIEFSIGRLAVYISMGALFGYFGYWLYKLLVDPRLVSGIWIAISVYLIVLGATMALGREGGIKFCRLHSGENMITLGVLAGLSPCFPLLAVMTEIALFSKSAAVGALYALVFGLGTVISPLVVLGALIPFIPSYLLRSERTRYWFSAICGIVMVLSGLYLLIKMR
ncbi:MAG TPA: sulfite exporter TauE/SafE family protein [Candidatus Omnitrophota bacterium]|nr:sulfite exporter TauE/SafE family protein [Candidatus Omnitrophota bacterium]